MKTPKKNATTRSARYKVKTADGFVTRTRNQRKHRRDWVSLGVHELTTEGVVKLNDATGERGGTGRRVAFDAVKFEPVDGPAASSTSRSTPTATPNPKPKPDPIPAAKRASEPKNEPTPEPTPIAEPTEDEAEEAAANTP